MNHTHKPIRLKTIAELQKELKDFTINDYKSLKKEVEEQVVERFWANSCLFKLEPYYFEINKIKPGKKLVRNPKLKKNKCQYGIKKQGEIIAERNFTEYEDYFYETFYIRVDGVVMEYRFSYDTKSIERIYQFVFDKKGKVTNHIGVYNQNFSCQYDTAEYSYDNKSYVISKKWYLQYKKFSTERNQTYTYNSHGLQTITENGEQIFSQKT